MVLWYFNHWVSIVIGLAHCGQCDLKENLWLCLICGSLGCGRQLFGGAGGNGHGLAHFKETGHAVSVKLGRLRRKAMLVPIPHTYLLRMLN
jgi:uncharacterized UBP type Zn finger protein